ncbi:MAG TPA: hypothetical protein VLC28_15330, partial [Flavitalea sp.]|nr:hypothetical protein [Flavitalea sp.]
MRRMCLWFTLLLFSFAFTVLESSQSNNTPKVTILKPIANKAIGQESMVPYKVEVKDVEDGFSGYDEIIANQVFMKFSWISEAGKLATYEAKEKANAKLYGIIAMNGCLNCHAF